MTMLTVGELVKDRHHDELIVQPDSVTVGQAVALMRDRDVGAVLGMSAEGPFSGIFTERDSATCWCASLPPGSIRRGPRWRR